MPKNPLLEKKLQEGIEIGRQLEREALAEFMMLEFFSGIEEIPGFGKKRSQQLANYYIQKCWDVVKREGNDESK